MSSSSSSQSRKPNRRISSMQDTNRLARNTSRVRPKTVDFSDVYTYTLRVAYLNHLLQPKTKRKQYVPAPIKRHTRSATATSLNDIMTDLKSLHSSRTKTQLPHNFMELLGKRMTLVLQGREILPGYNDATVKKVFAEAYNAFTDENFQKQMGRDRRVDDLLLIFYSKTASALQKGLDPEDTSWKDQLERHLALFVRLIANILKGEKKDRDRPELMSRLASIEKTLLTHGQDLAVGMGEGGSKGSTIEVTVPLSQDIKDMKMVQTVAQIFGKPLSQVQADLNVNKKMWTEEAALKDLKSYQHCLNGNTPRTLRSEDFDLEEAYQAWKKAEVPELAQLMLDIARAKPEAANTTSGANKPLPPLSPTSSTSNDQAISDLSKSLSSPTSISGQNEIASPTALDQPFDMSLLSLKDEPGRLYLEEATYTFIPPDPRAFYRSILVHAVTFDRLQSIDATDGPAAWAPLSKQSLELLTELCVRWRIPQFSRLVLFIDVVSEKFIDQESGFSLEELDTAFEFVKNGPPEIKKPGSHIHATGLASYDQSQWTIHDFALYRQTLSNLYDTLLRDLSNLLQHCYDSKPPSPGPVLHVLETHITSDPSFSKSPEEIATYTEQLADGLRQRAAAVYREYLETEVPLAQEEWQFYHVIKLGNSVVKLSQRIQKRYRKNPEIMGVTPLTLLIETMFPSFEQDADHLIQRILEVAKAHDTELDLEDGFELYKELVAIRRIHLEVLPGTPFAFRIEDLLSDFVWRWIHNADSKMIAFVDQAIVQDKFQVRNEHPDQVALDDERHSVSIIDIFSLFRQTVDQIFQLEWDDDVQYAKFMTAMAKSFGNGLARYCETVEKKFKQEMDRLSPEQEAAALQSKQEKWMQIAKDAWSNKDRIQPFQFYPESFVKFNNIEYAIQELDKLEKTMNVDACAEVLMKAAPPQERQRRVNKYVFTVKIVEAEELKACDANGTSDPYVILGDEKQRRLHKTRVINRNLNPRWDESVDINVTGPVNIIATIWDSDTFGDDDFVGRTSLKLDPANFRDFLPKEYWLDLDVQGRLLLRVSMEGERDDIQFYFGKAFRLLKRTERDMTRAITDKLSQYINSCLSREALKSLLSRNITVASVTSMWKNRQSVVPTPTTADYENALRPLFAYFNENFAIMKQTLTEVSMIMVMARLWKEVLMAIEALLVPPLSDKPASQQPLTQQELDIVFHWLGLLLEFFNARDEETGEVMGVPSDVLKSPKYHEINSLNFFYFDETENLIRTSERMASATAQRVRDQRKRFTAPPSLGASFGGPVSIIGMGSIRRAKSIMLSRNLGTMKKAKEEKRKEAQADPSDDMILRILRMRPEAATYLRNRSRQKERLAAAAAADMIVAQSLASGGGARFGANNLPRR